MPKYERDRGVWAGVTLAIFGIFMVISATLVLSGYYNR